MYKEGSVALEDLVKFLKHKGNTEEALSLGCTVDGCVETSHPFKPPANWTVLLVNIELLIIHLEFKLRVEFFLLWVPSKYYYHSRWWQRNSKNICNYVSWLPSRLFNSNF